MGLHAVESSIMLVDLNLLYAVCTFRREYTFVLGSTTAIITNCIQLIRIAKRLSLYMPIQRTRGSIVRRYTRRL